LERVEIIEEIQREIANIEKQATNRKSSYVLDNFEEKMEQIKSFHESFYYKPAEIAIEHNRIGINLALDGKFEAAVHEFQFALGYLQNSAFQVNLIYCLKKMNKTASISELPVIPEVDHILQFVEEGFLTPNYIPVDRKGVDSADQQLTGYTYVFERTINNSGERKNLLFHVPSLIWRDFYQVFIQLLQTQYNVKTKKIIPDEELLLFEVDKKQAIIEDPNQEIEKFPIAEVEIPADELEFILNLYKQFIFDYYLQKYDRFHLEEQYNNRDFSLDEYQQYYGVQEEMYALLNSSLANLNDNINEPFITLNEEVYYKSIATYRSFFPDLFPDEVIYRDYLEATLDDKLLKSIKNDVFRRELHQVLQTCLQVTKNNPESIFVHIRQGLEAVFSHIVDDAPQKYSFKDKTLANLIGAVFANAEYKRYIIQPVLDLECMATLKLFKPQKFNKWQLKDYLHKLRKHTNEHIHFGSGQGQERIDSFEALKLVEQLFAVTKLLIIEFEI
jgi:hypothetical protein